MLDTNEDLELDNQPEDDEQSEQRKKVGRPRREDRISDPESMMTSAVQENLRVLNGMRIKVEKLVKKVSDTLDKHSAEGDNQLEQQLTSVKTLSDVYKTISDSTANAVKALGSLKKFQPAESTAESDAEILKKIFEDNSNEENT